MSYSQNMDSNIQKFNSSTNTIKENSKGYSEINHTRGGYIYKIINNLLISRPKVFAPYLLKSQKYKRSLIQNSHCKSIAMILVTLMTLPQQSNMNTNLMLNNPANFQNDNSTQQNEHQDLLKATLEPRLELLEEVLTRCISTIDNKDMDDLQNNFCYVINNIFLREFANKKDFISFIIEQYYDQLMTTFLKAKEDHLGNKVGVVVLSITGRYQPVISLIERCHPQ